MNTFEQFEAELAAALAPAPRQNHSESESGLGTARALTAIVDQLSRLSGTPLTPAEQQQTFALALRQVDARGRPTSQALNKPDISYLTDIGGTPHRVNIEIETQNLRRHVAMVNRDRQAHNVFVLANPWTGAIQGGLERAPGSPLRRLTASEAQTVLAGLPAPRRDPTLAVNPLTGTQIRRTLVPRQRPVRRPVRESEFRRPSAVVKPVNGNGAMA